MIPFACYAIVRQLEVYAYIYYINKKGNSKLFLEDLPASLGDPDRSWPIQEAVLAQDPRDRNSFPNVLSCRFATQVGLG